MWFQILDEYETGKLERDYFESMSCSFLYGEDIVNNGVHIQNSLILGYRGTDKFQEAVGKFDKLLKLEKSSTYPWFIDYKRSSVTISETSGTQTCALYRDWETAWTEIQLKTGTEITMNMGYFMYENKDLLSTNNYGWTENLKLTVLDSAMSLGLTSLAAASAIALLA